MEESLHNCSRNCISALIVKVVDYCNFTCHFCRYPNNPHRTAMPFSTFRTSIEKACDYNITNGYYQLTIIFHGGEPLLWGYENFLSAIQLQKEILMKYPKFKFKNSIQTNGSLLNDKWIDLFAEYDFNVGVSIDGPNEINFHKGIGNNSIVLDNIKKLAQKECKFGILSVITNDHDGYADKYYEFLIEHNIHSVGFCYCVYDYDKHITVKNSILTGFLKQFFIRYFEGDYQLNVREFDNVIQKCMNLQTHSCTFANRQRCGNYLSIRPNGDVHFCDPYKLEDLSIGNILNETFFDIKANPILTKIVLTARASATKKCNSCEINNICGGGCYRNVLPNGENIFCETFKALYPYIRDTITVARHDCKISDTI